MEPFHLAEIVARSVLGEGCTIEPAGSGSTRVFRLTLRNDSRILKLAKPRDHEGLAREFKVIQLISERGIPAPKITLWDASFSLIGLPYLIMECSGRRRVADYCLGLEDRALGLFAEMGQTFARVHAIALPDAQMASELNLFPRSLDVERSRLLDVAAYFVSIGWLELSIISWLGRLVLPTRNALELCHGDFHAVQCLDDGGRVSAIVDWESAWVGDSFADLAMTETYLRLYCSVGLIDAFRAGYASFRPMLADYEANYTSIKAGQALALAYTFHENGAVDDARTSIKLLREYFLDASKGS